MRSQPMWEREWEVIALMIPEFPWATDSWVSYPEKQGEVSYPLIGNQRDRELHFLGLTCLEQSFHHTRLGRSLKEGIRVQVQQNSSWVLVDLKHVFLYFLYSPEMISRYLKWLGVVVAAVSPSASPVMLVSLWSRSQSSSCVFLDCISPSFPLSPSLLPGSWCLRICRWANGICSGCYHPGFRIPFKLGNPSRLFLHSTGSWIFKSL